jgi:hypothetical protein
MPMSIISALFIPVFMTIPTMNIHNKKGSDKYNISVVPYLPFTIFETK